MSLLLFQAVVLLLRMHRYPYWHNPSVRCSYILYRHIHDKYSWFRSVLPYLYTTPYQYHPHVRSSALYLSLPLFVWWYNHLRLQQVTSLSWLNCKLHLPYSSSVHSLVLRSDGMRHSLLFFLLPEVLPLPHLPLSPLRFRWLCHWHLLLWLPLQHSDHPRSIRLLFYPCHCLDKIHNQEVGYSDLCLQPDTLNL